MEALQEANLVVVDYRLVRSELNNGFHSAPGNIKSDAIFVCFERPFAPKRNGHAREIDLREADRRMAAFASAVAELSWSPSHPYLEELHKAQRAARASPG